MIDFNHVFKYNKIDIKLTITARTITEIDNADYKSLEDSKRSIANINVAIWNIFNLIIILPFGVIF